MTDALEGSAPPKPTLKDEANAARIGRARFIGHTVGLVLVVALIEIGLTAAGLKQTRTVGTTTLTRPSQWLLLGGSLVLLLGLLDLGVRRRHDRGRSGIDVMITLLLLEAAAVVALFGWLPPSVPAVVPGTVAALCGLYLLVTLALLPGSKSDNRYGSPVRRHD